MFKYVVLNVTIPHSTPRFSQVYLLLQLRCLFSRILLWTIKKVKWSGRERAIVMEKKPCKVELNERNRSERKGVFKLRSQMKTNHNKCSSQIEAPWRF